MISRDNTKMVTFDWEMALDFNGQASPYIQYAYVRAGSILRKVNWEMPAPLPPEHDLTQSEVQLIEAISHFPEEVIRAASELKTMHVANHAYDLARSFSDFYNECPVLQADESVRNFRLRLVQAARQVIRNGLYLLGINVPEAM
jgi:arginyl-tRNA synthetase